MTPEQAAAIQADMDARLRRDVTMTVTELEQLRAERGTNYRGLVDERFGSPDELVHEADAVCARCSAPMQRNAAGFFEHVARGTCTLPTVGAPEARQ